MNKVRDSNEYHWKKKRYPFQGKKPETAHAMMAPQERIYKGGSKNFRTGRAKFFL